MHARKLIGTLAAAALAATATTPAHAAELSCPSEPSSRIFLRWLDPAHYVPMPGGSFEQDGWTLTGGAQRVPGNEPWRVAGADHASALSLPAGATAVSPPVCVSVDRPTIRAFARNDGGLLGSVRVNVLVPTALGEVRLPVGLHLDPTGRWAPTLPMPVVANLLTLLGGPGDVRFEFVSGGDWLVDDVYVDPYSKH